MRRFTLSASRPGRALMRRSRIAFIMAAFLLPLGGLGLLAGPAAQATTTVALCTQGLSPNVCMNRAGGGTRNGTPIIGYTKDFDNNEDFSLSSLPTDCDGSVHNGEDGMTCPFDPGTGLNARYDGRPIYTLYSSSTNKCGVAAPTILLALQPCSDAGVAFVLSSANYLINAYYSNLCFNGGCNGVGLGTNMPEFLCSDGLRGRLEVMPNGNAGFCQWFTATS